MITKPLRETKIVFDDELMTRETKFDILEHILHYLFLYQNMLETTTSYEATRDYLGEVEFMEEELKDACVVGYK